MRDVSKRAVEGEAGPVVEVDRGQPFRQGQPVGDALPGGVGAGASRLISGTQTPHVALETTLAKWKRAPAAICFSSGYAAALVLIIRALERNGWNVLLAEKFVSVDREVLLGKLERRLDNIVYRLGFAPTIWAAKHRSSSKTWCRSCCRSGSRSPQLHG